MSRTNLLLGCGLVALTLALTWYWQRLPLPQAESSASAPSPAPQNLAAQQAALPATTPEQQRLLQSPQAREQQQRLAFHNRYRHFIEQADSLDAKARQAELDALSGGLDDLERRGELALSETLLLQLGLIKASTADEAQQKAQAEALIERYRAISARREQRLAQKPDPNFERYKAEEKRIVEEVLALQNIPDGLSRDQYLRQRLQQARERSYDSP